MREVKVARPLLLKEQRPPCARKAQGAMCGTGVSSHMAPRARRNALSFRTLFRSEGKGRYKDEGSPRADQTTGAMTFVCKAV